MTNFPFEVPPSSFEIYRQSGKNNKTVFVIEQQMFNWTIKRYTDPIYWNTQW